MSEDNSNDFVIMDDNHIKLLIFCKNNGDINNAISNGPSEITSLVNNTVFPDLRDMQRCLYKLGEHKNWYANSELQKIILEKFGDDCIKYISGIFQTQAYTQKQYISSLKTHDRYTDDGRVFDDEGYDQRGYNIDGYDRWGYDEEGYDDEGYNEHGVDRDGVAYMDKD